MDGFPPGLGLAVQTVSPSGDPTGATDTARVQAAINQIRSTGVPGAQLILNAGIFYLSTSLDLTNITSNIQSVVPGEGLGGGSIAVRGAGTGATRIVVKLAAPRPALDFTGSPFATISDLSITGASGFAQSAGVLAARSNTANLGDHLQLDRVHIDGSYSLVAYANVSADQSVIRNCQLGANSPRSVVIDQTDILGVTSAYQTFTSVTANTLHEFDNCSFSSATSSAILYGKGSSLLLVNPFFSGPVGSTYCVEINASGDTNQPHSIYAINARSEGFAAFLGIPAGGYTSKNGHITGTILVNNGGAMVTFADANGIFAQYVMNAQLGGTTPAGYFAGGGIVRNNLISTYGGTGGVGIGSINNASFGNLVLRGADAAWAFPDTSQPNLQIGSGGLTLNGTIGAGNGAAANLTALAKSTGSGPASDQAVTWLQETIHGAVYWIPLFQ